jgi:hypothetical protein
VPSAEAGAITRPEFAPIDSVIDGNEECHRKDERKEYE